LKIAAIDIGSNAVRLLICKVNIINEKVVYTKELMVRAPIRLGEQAFIYGEIYENRIQLLAKAMQSFKNLMEIYQVTHYKAFATSAMREAQNGKEVIDRIYAETNIKIDKIDGDKEATTIFENYKNRINEKHEGDTFLSIDVGGGSTELILFNEEKILAFRSFKTGTLRVKNFLVDDSLWIEMEKWLKALKKEHHPKIGFGSGGNIIKIHKLYMDGNFKKPITLTALKEAKKHLESFNLRQRIHEMGLKPDRADVIVPAAEIFTRVMTYGGINKLYIPKMGLSDGIIKLVYEEYKEQKEIMASLT